MILINNQHQLFQQRENGGFYHQLFVSFLFAFFIYNIVAFPFFQFFQLSFQQGQDRGMEMIDNYDVGQQTQTESTTSAFVVPTIKKNVQFADTQEALITKAAAD